MYNNIDSYITAMLTHLTPHQVVQLLLLVVVVVDEERWLRWEEAQARLVKQLYGLLRCSVVLAVMALWCQEPEEAKRCLVTPANLKEKSTDLSEPTQ